MRLGDLTEKREPKLGGLGKGSGSRRSCKEPNPEGELRGVSKNREAREFDSIGPQSLLQGFVFNSEYDEKSTNNVRY